ncbi:MAG: DNA polymerase III subunit delta [Bacillota bacterium]
MSYRSFINDIKNQSIKNVLIVFGSETYLIDKALEQLKGAVVTAFPELNYIMLEGEHLKAEQMSAVCETFPFGCERRLVVVRNLNALMAISKNDGQEASDAAASEIQAFIGEITNISAATCLVFLCYGSIDKRKKLFIEIKKKGAVYEFDRVERDEYATWIKNVLGKAHKRINPKELDYFISNSGYIDKNSSKTLYDVENELKKLISFMGDNSEVDIKHIHAVLPKNIEHDIFKLINACSERRVSDSLRVYNDLLLEDESSMGILAMLSRQIKNIIAVQELYLRGSDLKPIADRLKLHEFTVKLCLKYGEKISKSKLSAALNKCVEAEMKIKSGRMSERLAIEMLLVSLFD